MSLNLDECFWWLSGWKPCPTYTVAGMFELYEQLLPTRLYTCKKTHTDTTGGVMCRLCNKVLKVYVTHVLAGCTALAQNKHTTRHNAALKILFFEILQDWGLLDSVPPWYSPIKPKPVYESNNAQAFWDVPLFAEHQVRANRVDACIINHASKRVISLEMSCPWVTNRKKRRRPKSRNTNRFAGN